MATTPKDAMRCGCGLYGSGTRLGHTNPDRLSEMKWLVSSTENTTTCESLSWWCNECRRAEYLCLRTELGRHCETGLSRLQ